MKLGVRAIIVALLAIAAAILVLRSAFVQAYAERDPARAAKLWPDHPAVTLALGLFRIGEQAAGGRPVTRQDTQPLLDAARSSPLAPEPFMVRGVELRLAGDEAAAGLAFGEALRRDPRSIAARFFLADHHLRSGGIEEGLGQIAAIARITPQSTDRIAPVLATYAETPGAAPKVRAMLRHHPKLEAPVLHALAANPANADLILSIANRRPLPDGSRPGWQDRLVEGLFIGGDHAKARSVWMRLTGVSAQPGANLLFDPTFEEPTAMPPFGWTLTSGAGGLVEPQAGGLHVIYYGRDNMVLASQALMLRPGPHELKMKVAGGGEAAEALAWTVTCLPSKAIILNAGLSGRAGGMSSGRFVVPPSGCTAQRIELSGKAPDFPQTVDLTLSGLALTRAAGR